MTPVKPIFIFSLPRSGSTLLQRVLMSHSKVSSAGEPWLLLPLVSMVKKTGTASVYSHQTSQIAIEDLIRAMPDGKKEYNIYLRQFVESVYQSVSNENSIYFIDKTPRYYLIIPEIAELFPDAKYIFLFRNPIQIYASIITTWGAGSLRRLFHHKVDLREGPIHVTDGFLKLKDKAYSLRYEDFVQNPRDQLVALLDYLGLKYEEGMLASLSAQAASVRTGDQVGDNRTRGIDPGSLDKWKSVFNNRFRKRILRKYIESIPEQTLQVQGYDKIDILMQIKSVKTKWVTPPRDYLHYFISIIAIYLRIYFIFAKDMIWASGRHVN